MAKRQPYCARTLKRAARVLLKEGAALRSLAARSRASNPKSLLDRAMQSGIGAEMFYEMAWDLEQKAKRK